MIRAKLWMRVLHEGVKDLIADGIGRHVKTGELQRRILTSPIIGCRWRNDAHEEHCDNHAAYLATLAQLPPIVAPYEVFWVEFSGIQIGDQHGALVSMVRHPDRFAFYISQIQGTAGQIPFRACEWRFSTDPQGRLLTNTISSGGNALVRSVAGADVDEQQMEFANTIHSMVDLHSGALFSMMSLLSCKNVGLRALHDDTKQVQKAVRHRGGMGDYRYHVLIVRPAGARADHPGVELDVMPFHSCRGHFSEYGPEFGKGLLFGRLAGRFYVAPHMRGKRDRGIVEKDYQIHESVGAY